MSEPMHTIQQAAERAGITAHVVRAWEKRYGAVQPARTGTQRRRYTEEDVERLTLLAALARAGHAIGGIARLPQKRLQEMAWAVGSVGGDHAVHEEPASLIFINKLDRALQAVRQLDSVTLGEVLREAEIELGPQGVLQRVIAPLMQMIGEQWREGLITAAHEHFASAVIRIFLGHAARPFAASPDAPVLTVATPTGQLHELGALLVGAYAANLGWKVVYLGASLGAADIAGASLQNRTHALALSLVYPEDDPQLGAELVRLREALPGVPIIAGGRAVSSYLTALEKIKAITVTDLTSFGRVLDGLRKRGAGGLAATSLGSG